MLRVLIIFTLVFTAVLVVDQIIKCIFVQTNFTMLGEYIDLVLTYNKGVAFSLFEFVGEWLKWIQVVLILGIFSYLIYEKILLKLHTTELGAILGAGTSNVLDRFNYGGVVDYIFWHKWFNFAVFNLADVIINLALFGIILKSFFNKNKK